MAWLLTKAAVPVVGCAKLPHIQGSAEEIAYLEFLCRPHPLVGVMAQNTAASATEDHVWSLGSQTL